MKQKIKKLFTIHHSLFTDRRGFTPHLCKGAGFTLIEIAIVLIIIGILVALGAALIGPLTKRAKYNETKDIVSAAAESVISYGASNKKLPLFDEFVEIVRNPRDAWTKTLYYIVDSNLTTIPTGSIDAICGRKTTDLIICRDATCTVATNITNVAFIVISGADNYNVQTGIITAEPCPAGKTCVRVYEVGTSDIDDCTNSTNCPNYPSAEMINRPEPYDDIVKWVTLDELRIKTGCVGAQLKILNNELPYGYQESPYSAIVYADGGVPFSSGGRYRWCRQGTAPAGLTFTPNTFSTDCSGLSEESWGQADNLTISGTPTGSGSSGNFNPTFFVRDNNDPVANNDNIAQKTLSLTINPAVAVTDKCIEEGIDVRNETGGDVYGKENDACDKWGKKKSITVLSGVSYYVYSDSSCVVSYCASAITYSQQKSYDSNNNCKTKMNLLCTFADR